MEMRRAGLIVVATMVLPLLLTGTASAATQSCRGTIDGNAYVGPLVVQGYGSLTGITSPDVTQPVRIDQSVVNVEGDTKCRLATRVLVLRVPDGVPVTTGEGDYFYAASVHVRVRCVGKISG